MFHPSPSPPFFRLLLTKRNADTLINESSKAQKSFLLRVEMQTSTTAGGLQHNGLVSTTRTTIFPPQPFSLVRQPAGKTSTSLPFPFTETSSRRSYGKPWCIILGDVLVVCAAAYFWEGGARFFIGGFVLDAVMKIDSEVRFVQ